MNPQCAKCSKTVYPTEKLHCLDKYWHKGCFKCDTCGLTLTMRNYKGYNKKPYCNSHYPTTKFTAVADTPENLRLKKQSQNQSTLVYQKEHRDNLQRFTTVADDPESMRLKKASAQSSQVAYKAAAPPPSGGSSAPPPSMQRYDAPPPGRSYEPPRNDPPYQPPPQPAPVQQPPPAQPQLPPPASSGGGGGGGGGGGSQYVAIYDYAAADDDEVSFSEGDMIVNTEIIDQGWMSGTVQRTGETGMLPSNYVEPY